MDANKSDEARNRRREEVLARRMGEALDQLAPAAMRGKSSETCPDAEQIAAYHERALGPEEIAQREAHFAGCSRCRKILAVLAASTDAPLAEHEVARIGQLSAARPPQAPLASAPEIVRSRRPFHLDGRLPWLAPALGVAAALAAWFAMRPPWRALERHSSSSLVAQGPQNEGLPSATARSLPAEQRAFSAPAGKQADSRASSTIPETKPAPHAKALQPPEASAETTASREPYTPVLGANSPPALSNLKGENNERVNVDSAAAPSPQAAPAPQALVRAREAQLGADGQAATAAPALEPRASASQSATVTGEAPLVATSGSAAPTVQQAPVSNLPLNGRNFQAAARLQSATAAIQVVAPLGNVLWQIGENGRIERSVNGGNTWSLQASPSHADWLAGAAVSESTCWIVGRDGAIARTTDGEYWEKIVPPPSVIASGSGKSPDWISVTATGPQTAMITASDQRRFATQNGGKTWQAH